MRPGESAKYNSQELDKETNYYFYNARHYDPEICRFVTADTIVDEQFGIGTQGWNRYSYVKNNPIIYKDPTGHVIVIPAAIVVGIIVANVVLTPRPLNTGELPKKESEGLEDKYKKDSILSLASGSKFVSAIKAVTRPIIIGAKKKDIQEIDHVAKKHKIDRKEFSEFVHVLKESGERGTKNKKGDFTKPELDKLALQFKDLFAQKKFTRK